MDFLTWGRDPWGESVLTHISWNLFWGSLFAGVLFLVAHASYMFLSAHHKRTVHETDALEVKYEDAPTLSKSMRIARDDLKLSQLVVVYPGEVAYALADNVRVVPVSRLSGDMFGA